MKLLTTLAIFLSAVVATDWTLYCGSSCSNGTAIATGSGYVGAACTDFGTTFEYCYLDADETYYKAVIFEGEDCVVSSNIETPIFSGECTDQGTWSSYLVTINL